MSTGIKVVFHIDEPEKWKLLLGNVQNLIHAVDEVDSVVVVANSTAVKSYLKTEPGPGNRMQKLADQNVRFCACNNALNGLNIAPDQLMPFVEIVPAGVKEIVDLQMQGYAYLKP